MMLSGGDERSGTGVRSGQSLIERMKRNQSMWMKKMKKKKMKRKGHCVEVGVGAGRAWAERGCEGRTGCGCAESVTGRGGEVRRRRPGAWMLVGRWSVVGVGTW